MILERAVRPDGHGGKRWIRHGMYALAFCQVFFALGAEEPYQALLGAVVCLWGGNMLYALERLRERILFFWFHVTLFTFLIGRPLITAMRGQQWWDYGHENVLFALTSLLLTQLFLYLGAVLGQQRALRLQKGERKREEGFCYYLSWVSQIVFYLSLLFTFMLGQEKIAYIADHTYYAYFAEFKSRLPYSIYELSTLTRYSLCFFLACRPKKSRAFPALCLYVLAAVPELIVGERNPIVLRAIFALSYYVLRDSYREKEAAAGESGEGQAGRAEEGREDKGCGLAKERPWIGKLEKAALLAGIPCGMVFLGMMDYLREGGGIKRLGFFGAIADLFYKQGVSFRWLALGHGAIKDLPGAGATHYTFGSLLDYLLHGSIAQRFFGATALGSNNSLVKAKLGHSLAHHMSYLLMGEEEYLAGHGCGSSYLLELFIDHGYLGIGVFSLGLGYLLLVGPEFARRHTFFFALLLLCMTNLFLIPRAEATGFLTFVLTLQFWVSAAICCGGALLLRRKFYPRKGRL